MSPALSRRALLAGALTLPVAAAAGCGSDEPNTTSGAPDRVTYLTSFSISARECYAHVAQAKGFFTEANLVVDIQPGQAGAANHQALLSGAAQFAAMDSSGAFIRHTSGTDGGDAMRIIAAVHQQSLMGLLSFTDVGITTPGDLEGRTIGLAAGSIAETLWPAYASLANIDSTTVEVVATNPAGQTAQLAAGQLDAIALFVVSTPSVRAAGDGEPVSALAWAEYLSDLYGNVIVTTSALVNEQPGMVRRFRTALLRGLEHTLAHPEEAAGILADSQPELDPEVSITELAAMAPYCAPPPGQPLGTMDPAKVARAIGILQQVDAIPEVSDLPSEQDIMAWQLVPGEEGSQP